MQDIQVMLDLETLGNKPDAAIISIGAVKFDLVSGTITEQFHVAIDPESCEPYGLRMSASTVAWWMADEREEARRDWNSHSKLDLPTALHGFQVWFGGNDLDAKSLPTWGNGAGFDNVILRNAYEKVGLACPFEFWDDRCYRTIKALAGSKPERIGTHHNALDDARTQAVHLINIMKDMSWARAQLVTSL